MNTNSPQKVNLKTIDLSETKPAEDAFKFWDNPEDSIYDEM